MAGNTGTAGTRPHTSARAMSVRCRCTQHTVKGERLRRTWRLLSRANHGCWRNPCATPNMQGKQSPSRAARCGGHPPIWATEWNTLPKDPHSAPHCRCCHSPLGPDTYFCRPCVHGLVQALYVYTAHHMRCRTETLQMRLYFVIAEHDCIMVNWPPFALKHTTPPRDKTARFTFPVSPKPISSRTALGYLQYIFAWGLLAPPSRVPLPLAGGGLVLLPPDAWTLRLAATRPNRPDAHQKPPRERLEPEPEPEPSASSHARVASCRPIQAFTGTPCRCPINRLWMPLQFSSHLLRTVPTRSRDALISTSSTKLHSLLSPEPVSSSSAALSLPLPTSALLVMVHLVC